MDMERKRLNVHEAAASMNALVVVRVSACIDAIWIQLQDAVTSEVLCTLSRDNGGLIYGTGSEVGNEAGFLVGLERCSWTADTAPTFARDHPMRLIAAYNSSAERFGVMAQWKFAVVADELSSNDRRARDRVASDAAASERVASAGGAMRGAQPS
jgi:hypothetical protein